MSKFTRDAALALLCVALLSEAATPAIGATFENERLVIRDVSGSLPPAVFEGFARKVDSTLTHILRFWSTVPRTEQFGKIMVELDSSKSNGNYSLFFFRRENGRRVRVVKVTGGNGHPLQLAHKLTSALFPNPDKLIRNMMGEASENRFGNPLSFPMCGFEKDDWVAALLLSSSYIPLTSIGTEHSDWGMEIRDNMPVVKDRARQHACYAEAGSFGDFLIDAYGVEQMKRFNQLSISKPRPWEEAFGLPLVQLEARWLEAVRSRSKGRAEELAIIIELLKEDPKRACFSAQKLAEGRKR